MTELFHPAGTWSRITPADAGWRYLTFGVERLDEAQQVGGDDDRLRPLHVRVPRHHDPEQLLGPPREALPELGEERLRRIETQMRSDKVMVAFVAEFSRGKSELINAIFFADAGRRVLPATPGRTTMCPVELAWDAEHPNLYRLDAELWLDGKMAERVTRLPSKYRSAILAAELATTMVYRKPLEPDFGAAVVLCATGIAVLFVAGARLRAVDAAGNTATREEASR